MSAKRQHNHTQLEWTGQKMRYVLAVSACVGIFVAYVLIGAAVFGWQHGGGVLPMAILLAAIGATWRKITYSKTSKNISRSGAPEARENRNVNSDLPASIYYVDNTNDSVESQQEPHELVETTK